MKFRDLKENEIDVRIGRVSGNSVKLLLFKDARCDMNILDETVGSLNWTRSHQVINDNLFATVCIWDEKKSQWICKSDVGNETNVEKIKGESSDSFKRACFNWGIGRKLYTAPEITVHGDANKLKWEKFRVHEIEYDDNKITKLTVLFVDGNIAFTTDSGKKPIVPPTPAPEGLSVVENVDEKVKELYEIKQRCLDDIDVEEINKLLDRVDDLGGDIPTVAVINTKAKSIGLIQNLKTKRWEVKK